jgi:hypothetical protein
MHVTPVEFFFGSLLTPSLQSGEKEDISFPRVNRFNGFSRFARELRKTVETVPDGKQWSIIPRSEEAGLIRGDCLEPWHYWSEVHSPITGFSFRFIRFIVSSCPKRNSQPHNH